MKLLLVCGAGMSCDLLEYKLNEYLQENEPADAKGQTNLAKTATMLRYQKLWRDYDVVLVSPQIASTLRSTLQEVTIPWAIMNRLDYGRMNVAHIWKQARKLYQPES